MEACKPMRMIAMGWDGLDETRNCTVSGAPFEIRRDRVRYKTNDRVKLTVEPFKGIAGTIVKRTLFHGYTVKVHNGIKITNVRSHQIAKSKN